MGRLARWGALLLAPAAAIGVASLPWVRPRPAEPPRLELAFQGEGTLSAGAGVAPIDVPRGGAIGGFPRLSYRSGGQRDEVAARALLLESGGRRVALVSMEILLVPGELADAVRARVGDLHLDAVIVAATHTHASPGGYWDNLAAERLALGAFDGAARAAVERAAELAIRRGLAAAKPARVSIARGRAEGLVRNRGDGGERDARLTVVRLAASGGEPIAELVLFGAHPTVLGKENRLVSGDWPGRFMAAGRHGVRLHLQGVIGDQTWVLPAGPATPDGYARALDAAVAALPFGAPDAAPALAFATTTVLLPVPSPAAAPALLRRAGGNLGAALLPARARVSALRLGPVILLAVPGEPVAAVAAAWRDEAGAGAEVLSLADGYVGYVETPARVGAGAGEAVRTYYGPDLASRLGRALQAVSAAAGPSRGGARALRALP